MVFPGHFDHIPPEKIHVLNVCFKVDGMKEVFGGTAGNIAYALRLMGEKPVISATIGRDYQKYFQWLTSNGISADGIRIIENEFTAGAFITTDRADNQITGFNPGAMKYSSCLDVDWLDPAETMMIVAPGNLEDMVKYPLECKARRIPCIFDPGQSLPMLDPKDLLQAIDGCMIPISNDYELDLIMRAHLDWPSITAAIVVDGDSKLESLVRELKKADFIAFDTETTGTDPVLAKLVGISLSVREGEGYYLPIGHIEGKQLTPDKIAQALKPLFETEKLAKVGHNARFVRSRQFGEEIRAFLLGQR